ncbi:hypothetical protein JOF56_010001 [Kibdelosporangium banguiense]|uniref:Uncharacterized protein n=1 Tax=Kibdelosporangium banguiense TaxID=1365924 RepID=A0ABS4TZ12_9PSEU|nr:hypothetical protein [Kibdelosporangium banguiense]
MVWHHQTGQLTDRDHHVDLVLRPIPVARHGNNPRPHNHSAPDRYDQCPACACRKPHPCWSDRVTDIDSGRLPAHAATTAGWPAVLQRLAYLGLTNTFALLCLLPMSNRDKTSRSSHCATRSQYCNSNSVTPRYGSLRLTGHCPPRSCTDYHAKRCTDPVCWCARTPSGTGTGTCSPRTPRRSVPTETSRTAPHHLVCASPGPAPGKEGTAASSASSSSGGRPCCAARRHGLHARCAGVMWPFPCLGSSVFGCTPLRPTPGSRQSNER